MHRNPNTTEDYININDLQRRPITIKVINFNAPDIETAVQKSDAIIESCLFQLSYMKHITGLPAEEWPMKRETAQPFYFEEPVRDNKMDFPRIICNSDVLRFYQRGMSTDDPVLRFLSFYQVLEYYFLEVSDELLYDKLARRLKDPKFTISTKDLDGIIVEVTKHKGETDETEMLKVVLNKYLDDEILINFIEAYESHFSEKIYTKKQNIFGTDLEVKLQSGHISGNLAKRIKTVRNALVHASDRYERSERYIPNRENEAIVKREVPLLKFLAEKVMIASSEPLK